MVRQTKRFKKGLNKKVLSAILAASMIMTSSSFAFASTDGLEPVAEDNTVVETQDVDAGETNTPSNEEAGTATLSEDVEAQDSAVAADSNYTAADFTITINDNKPLTFNGTNQKPR